MNNKKAHMGLAVFMLIIASCFVPSVLSENSSAPIQTNSVTPFAAGEPENMSVTLLAPVLNATISTSSNVSFTFVPAINGTDIFWGASLVVNGSIKASNQSAIVPYQNNTIYYDFGATPNGTYTWNIRLQNTTITVMAPTDNNLTIGIPEANTGIAVKLVAPANDATIKTTSNNVSFVFVPAKNGTNNQFYKATLVVNGSIISSATNQTALTPDVNNTIYYELTPNATYRWNVRLENATHTVTAEANNNFTFTQVTTPSATATPTPTPAPTAQPTAIPTATPHATATPTPTPEPGLGSDLWTLIIVAVIVFSVVLIVTIFLLRRRQ